MNNVYSSYLEYIVRAWKDTDTSLCDHWYVKLCGDRNIQSPYIIPDKLQEDIVRVASQVLDEQRFI